MRLDPRHRSPAGGQGGRGATQPLCSPAPLLPFGVRSILSEEKQEAKEENLCDNFILMDRWIVNNISA